MLSTSLPNVRQVSRLFRTLGDETRLRMVALLVHGELCVCHIQEALDLTQSNTSRQLSILRAAGIVEARRGGGWVYYALAQQADEDCRKHLRLLARTFGAQETLRRDIQRLQKSVGPDSCK